MPQINSGKSPPWVSGEIVTAAGLNGMIDAATLDPSAITSQSDFPTLTGNEYALIVDPASGLLKKTQLKNSLLTGEDIKTDSITQVTGSSAILTIESNPSVAMLLRGTGGLSLQTETGGITLNTIASGGTGSIGVQSNGMTFDGQGSGATGVIDFQTRTIFSYTGAIKLPVGTTAQRPASPVAGDTRFNSTLATQETYDGTQWTTDAIKVAVLTRQLTSGTVQTNAGSFWDSISYNTIDQSSPFVVNASSFTGVPSSAGSSTITLPAGTYTIDAEASIQSNGGAGATTVRIFNNTNSTTIKTGLTAYCASYSYGLSIVNATFTLTTQSNIIIQFYQTVAGNTATGNGISPATPEVIYTAKITKLA